MVWCRCRGGVWARSSQLIWASPGRRFAQVCQRQQQPSASPQQVAPRRPPRARAPRWRCPGEHGHSVTDSGVTHRLRRGAAGCVPHAAAAAAAAGWEGEAPPQRPDQGHDATSFPHLSGRCGCRPAPSKSVGPINDPHAPTRQCRPEKNLRGKT